LEVEMQNRVPTPNDNQGAPAGSDKYTPANFTEFWAAGSGAVDPLCGGWANAAGHTRSQISAIAVYEARPGI
jgi:hypothetical protein